MTIIDLNIRKSQPVYRAAFFLVIILLVTLVGCTNSQPKKSQELRLPEAADFSKASWIDAFDRMHAKISLEYAFTDWKAINWKEKQDKFRPRIVAAQKAKDEKAYYLALREYLFSIPDGHISLKGDETGYGPDNLGLMKSQVGGGFGMTVTLLDDKRLIVDWVAPNGPAIAAGIKTGAVIVKWGGQDAVGVLRKTSIIWATVPCATLENTEYEQTRFITRAAVGQIKEVDYINPGESAKTASLEAYDDGMESLDRTQQYSRMFFGEFPEKMVEARALEEGIGYIKIHAEGDLSEKHPGDHTPTLDQFRTAIDSFIAAKSPGIVIDVRSNAGGADGMSAAFMESFYAQKTLYEYQNWYDAASGKAAIALPGEDDKMQRNAGLYIEPEQSIFEGPVVVVVNGGCISSGEGIAMGINKLDNGSTVGFRGTNGSFGMVLGVNVLMPGGYSVSYPVGQSLDKDKTVQIDSRKGKGGVVPEIRVPRNTDTVLRAAAGEDVELEYAVETIKGAK